MSKRHRRIHTTNNETSFTNTIHDGFNYFHELEPVYSRLRMQRSHTKGMGKIMGGIQSSTILSGRQQSVSALLRQNKQTYSRIKSQFSVLRENELNDYIKKSMKYQEILNINDNKKKRLPTLNSKIGEVVKKSVIENNNKNVQYYLTTTHHKLEGWKPESRQGHTTTCYKNLAVIIGGHCSSPFPVAQVYSFDSNNWVKQVQVSSARSYHTSIFYKSRFIIVFGGMGAYDVSRKCRVCFNSINLIDLQTWTSRVIKMNNQQSIEGRRSHGAILMGKYMLVFGGMNTKRQYLKDFVYLDLKQLRWYHKEYKVESRQLSQNIQTGLARHKMISHFRESHKNLPLYSSEYTQQEGIYMFGGFFGNGEDNILTFISFNKYNPCFKKIEFHGSPPSSVQPLVQKVNDNLLMIISGESSQRKAKLFLLKQKQFISIYEYSTPPFFGGIGSTLTRHNEDLYLFFGLSSNGYIGTVCSLHVQEKVIEKDVKKKKTRQSFEIQWHFHKDNDSESELAQ